MEFAENGRISHRQLYRQMLLTWVAPLLLCMFGDRGIYGKWGIAGSVFALAFLCFYVIFLIRLVPFYNKSCGRDSGIRGEIYRLFFLLYVVLTAAFLLELSSEIVIKTLITGIKKEWISLATLLVCVPGCSKGMQKRGRMAEVSGGVLLAGILFLMLVCISQVKLPYFQEFFFEKGNIKKEFLSSCYVVLCGFSGLGLLPFLLEDVERKGSTARTVIGGLLTLGGILLGMELIFPSVFGVERFCTEQYPVLPLLSGADLPGNILARFDIIWMSFLLYSLLFSIGSLLHYGYLIMEKTKTVTFKCCFPAAVYLITIMNINGMIIEDFYMKYLSYFFIPTLLILQLYMLEHGKRRWKKHVIEGGLMLMVCMSLVGCSSMVDPENRIYPLALGIDISDDKNYVFTYGMPDLVKATGQEKGGDDNKNIIKISGLTFDEIKEKYKHSQNKYMDLGHLEVLVLGDKLVADKQWDKVIDYLKNEPFVGEDIRVFRGKNAEEIVSWRGKDGTCAGQYLTGIMENRMGKKDIRQITLREVFYEKYRSGSLCALPEVMVEGEGLEVKGQR